MASRLTRDEVRVLLEQARQSFPHDDCLTCECFLGYVAQLGIDADEGFAVVGLDRHEGMLAAARARYTNVTLGRPG